METAVVYYSYSGNTKKAAEALAGGEGAAIAEIRDVKRPGKLRAFTAGVFGALGGKAWPIQPLGLDLEGYERIVLMAPVWAGNPPPPFNAALELLPAGKTVSIKLVSGSGKSNCRERLEAAVKAKGGELESFEDIKA